MRALFEVGEEALDLWGNGTTHICTILSVEWDEHGIYNNSQTGTSVFYTGYVYLTTSSDKYSLEYALRKIHKPSISFDQLITELNRETVCE